jgi:glucokinase
LEFGRVSEPEVIGIDLGGTAIKLGRFRQDGTCLQSLSVATPQPATPTAVVEVMVEAIASLRSTNPHSMRLVLALLDLLMRRVELPESQLTWQGWHDVPLADLLEAKTGCPTILANDANCAGLGEAWLGAGRRFRNLILLTLGTGVGGAIILDGKLFTGHQGAAGELGLIALNPDGPVCNSGNQGSLEQYALSAGNSTPYR